jgi:murein L,D-transpeptidase YafK
MIWCLNKFFIIFICLIGGLSCFPAPLQVVRITRSVPVQQKPVPSGHWILIQAKQRTLTLMSGKVVKRLFKNVAFGSAGVNTKQHRGDKKTPLGKFTIGWTNPESRFFLFFGLTYPSLDDAQRGLKNKEITLSEFQRIQNAHRLGEVPPQNTALGGMIGIHGVGHGDVFIHRSMNWTDGCIALENDQISELSRWIFEGMVVEIKG